MTQQERKERLANKLASYSDDFLKGKTYEELLDFAAPQKRKITTGALHRT